MTLIEKLARVEQIIKSVEECYKESDVLTPECENDLDEAIQTLREIKEQI